MYIRLAMDPSCAKNAVPLNPEADPDQAAQLGLIHPISLRKSISKACCTGMSPSSLSIRVIWRTPLEKNVRSDVKRIVDIPMATSISTMVKAMRWWRIFDMLDERYHVSVYGCGYLVEYGIGIPVRVDAHDEALLP